MSILVDQYNTIKTAVPGCVLLMRIGDFYEAFGDDAKLVSKICGTAVTKRQGTLMTGIPRHQMQSMAGRLVANNHKVAVAESAQDEVVVNTVERK